MFKSGAVDIIAVIVVISSTRVELLNSASFIRQRLLFWHKTNSSSKCDVTRTNQKKASSGGS